MLTINMHEAKTRLSELVRKAEEGEDVFVARNGKPVIKLTPVAARPVRRLGVLRHLRDRQPAGWDERLPTDRGGPEPGDG